jgi:hypothetical protein
MFVVALGLGHQVEGGLLLDTVVTQGAAILQLLASKDQAQAIDMSICEIT